MQKFDIDEKYSKIKLLNVDIHWLSLFSPVTNLNFYINFPKVIVKIKF